MYKLCVSVVSGVLLAGCASGPTMEQIRVAQVNHDHFTDLCYRSAHEWIARTPERVNTIYMSPSSKIVGSYGFELFFGASLPRKWANAELVIGPPPQKDEYAKHVYEVRYTHIPVYQSTASGSLKFNGVRQQVVDLQKNEVIAERENYMWGTDFNRSSICTGGSWYADNNNFVDRVLGYRYRDESHNELVPDRHIKAKSIGIVTVKVELKHQNDYAAGLPHGAFFDYNKNRSVTLSSGDVFYVPHSGQEPMPLFGSMENETEFAFVHFADGSPHTWPVRQLLLFRRDKRGKAIERIFIQLPRSVDWSNGWGYKVNEISIRDGIFYFSLYGKRRYMRDGYQALQNVGEFTQRYDFSASLPDLSTMKSSR